MNKLKIILGDPSNDGHGKTKEFIISSNKTTRELFDGYKNSCKLTGIQFNSENKNFMNLKKLDLEDLQKRLVCCEYEDSKISEFAKQQLIKNGIKDSKLLELKDMQNSLLVLIMEFIKLSIFDLEYKIIDDEIEVFPLSFGYGLFY